MKIQRGYFFASSATQKATLIVSQPYANAERTLLYAVISHDTPGVRFEYATHTLDIRSVR